MFLDEAMVIVTLVVGGGMVDDNAEGRVGEEWGLARETCRGLPPSQQYFLKSNFKVKMAAEIIGNTSIIDGFIYYHSMYMLAIIIDGNVEENVGRSVCHSTETGAAQKKKRHYFYFFAKRYPYKKTSSERNYAKNVCIPIFSSVKFADVFISVY